MLRKIKIAWNFKVFLVTHVVETVGKVNGLFKQGFCRLLILEEQERFYFFASIELVSFDRAVIN